MRQWVDPEPLLIMPGSYVGFGFGAIQGGLFLPFAENSGNFDRLVVAEIEPEIIEGVRQTRDLTVLTLPMLTGWNLSRWMGLRCLTQPWQMIGKSLSMQLPAGELATALPSFHL